MRFNIKNNKSIISLYCNFNFKYSNMKIVKTVLFFILLILLSEPLNSQIKTIPNSFLGCWNPGIKTNPKSKDLFEKFPSIYYELKSNSFNIVKLDINGNETNRENCEFKVSNKSVLFTSKNILEEGVIYELNFDEINNPYEFNNKYSPSAPLHKYNCPVNNVQEINNNCPDGVLVSDKQLSGTLKKYRESDGHYYFQVTLKVNLNDVQKKYSKYLIFSSNKAAYTNSIKNKIGEVVVFKRVLENTDFYVTPDLKCIVKNYFRPAVIYFRDLKRIY
jgi:hypothetical protein